MQNETVPLHPSLGCTPEGVGSSGSRDSDQDLGDGARARPQDQVTLLSWQSQLLTAAGAPQSCTARCKNKCYFLKYLCPTRGWCMSIRHKHNPGFVSLALISERQSWAPKAVLRLLGCQGRALSATTILQLHPPGPWGQGDVLDELLSWDILVSLPPGMCPCMTRFSEDVAAFIWDL